MAKYRGSKGSLSIGGSSVGNLTSWEFQPERPYIEGTSMGDAAGSGTLDIPKGSGRAVVKLDKADAGQTALLDMLVSNADPTPVAAIFVVSGTGPKQITCNILPTRASITAQVGQYILATIEFMSDGAITFSWT